MLVLSPGHLHWVLVAHQCRDPIPQISQEGWPLLGRWHRMVSLRKGHLRGKMAKEGSPTCSWGFPKCCWEARGWERGDGGWSLCVGRERSCGYPTRELKEQRLPEVTCQDWGFPSWGWPVPLAWNTRGAAAHTARCATQGPSEGSGWQTVTSCQHSCPAWHGQPPGAWK